MSDFDLAGARPPRRRRADAERSITAILDATLRLLADRPEASMVDIAEAAGVTRQTIYAHFPSRDALLIAAVERATAEAVTAIDAAKLDEGTAREALLRFVDAAWPTFVRSPLLLRLPATRISSQEERDRHQQFFDRLELLIRRGQASCEFDLTIPRDWLITATIALGHAAGEQVATGRLRASRAQSALKLSLMRLYGTTPPDSPPDALRDIGAYR